MHFYLLVLGAVAAFRLGIALVIQPDQITAQLTAGHSRSGSNKALVIVYRRRPKKRWVRLFVDVVLPYKLAIFIKPDNPALVFADGEISAARNWHDVAKRPCHIGAVISIPSPNDRTVAIKFLHHAMLAAMCACRTSNYQPAIGTGSRGEWKECLRQCGFPRSLYAGEGAGPLFNRFDGLGFAGGWRFGGLDYFAVVRLG